MSIEAAEAVIEMTCLNNGTLVISTKKKNNDASSRCSGDRFETYRIMGAGHAFLVDNPLGLVDAIMQSLDCTTALQGGRIDIGSSYVVQDAALNSRTNHHGDPRPEAANRLPMQPGQRR